MWKLLFYLSAVAQRSAVWSAVAARNSRAFPLFPPLFLYLSKL